jgi:nitroimidazol reductase NimA-like FMN-containing flavoprotein (pyridoxamine 5'-phosphate oxidase superfamily)
MSREEIESYLKEAKIARLCTLNENGTIHAAPMWYVYENGRIKIGTPRNSSKGRNIRRNSKMTVLIDNSDVEPRQPKGIIVYGRAESIEDWADPKDSETTSSFKRYMPEEDTTSYANALMSLTSWLKIAIKPMRVGSFDYTKDEALHEALEKSRGIAREEI